MVFIWALLGGALVGLAAAAMLLVNGRVAGISGVLGGTLGFRAGDLAWRLWFLAGLVAGGVGLALIHPAAVSAPAAASMPVLIVAGLLVGFGTRLGGGCTSGHGVCGVGRLAPRSILATAIFVGTAALTVFVVRHLPGSTP
jgi:uncharacterized protein